MTDCKINFTKESEPLAYGIYQDLLEAGASCTDLDYGYNVTNYAGLYCPAKDARSCVKSKGDGVVEADEVKEYALDKEYELDPQKYAQYRKIIEGRLGEPLPWVLDDLDPATTFDADIRKRIQAAIDELKRIITAKGITEGSEKYNEMLAAGLTWFVAMPGGAMVEKMLQSFFGKMIIDRIEDDGLGEFVGYLKANGGIRVEGNYSEEYTALEALSKITGECTEISKILFAAMKMAGLRPVFIDEDLLKEKTKDPIIKKAIGGLPRDTAMFHLCIGLYISKRIRLFDPMFINSNANYKLYTPLSLRQYLSLDYSNLGNAWKKKGELDKAIAHYTRAIEIDPKSAIAYTNRGVDLKDKGKLDEAIADHTKAIEINPKSAIAYANRGNARLGTDELDKAIADYTRAIEIDPKYAPAYINCGWAWALKGELDKAISSYKKALAIEPKNQLALGNLVKALIEKGELKEATRQFGITLVLYPNEIGSLTEAVLTVVNNLWNSTDNREISSAFTADTNLDIAKIETFFIVAYSRWEADLKEKARQHFNSAIDAIIFKKKPSQATRKFLKQMLALMPAPMKKDKDVQEMLEALREKMK